MDKDTITPDGFYVDENGVWDGNPSTSVDKANIGPGASFNAQAVRYGKSMRAHGNIGSQMETMLQIPGNKIQMANGITSIALL